ncbi:hypothetical protein AGOR_G00066300 [Albula goreensis]|uniref:Uncharacterized protein n=1 Tax=Albula goreensis TaxID=1534307 RepID=A0A8T3DYX8_9TELE|nr:hypothetical protein AGOR_G00066300 [Albula goreensis]
MNVSGGLFPTMTNSTALEVIEEVFFNVWPFARYGLLFLMLTALVGKLLTDCVTRGSSSSKKIRNEQERIEASGKKATARRGESSRSSAVSEEAYYESI